MIVTPTTTLVFVVASCIMAALALGLVKLGEIYIKRRPPTQRPFELTQARVHRWPRRMGRS